MRAFSAPPCPLRLCVIVMAGALTVLPCAPLSATQNPASVRPTWADLETWTRLVPESRENEVVLGLQLAGPTAVMSVAISGRLSVREPNAPPREVTVLAARGDLANYNNFPAPVLTFLVDVKVPDRRATIDLTSRLTVDDPGIGVKFTSGVARMRAADLVRMAEAETIAANVFTLDVGFRADQIKALRALAVKLHLMKADQ